MALSGKFSLPQSAWETCIPGLQSNTPAKCQWWPPCFFFHAVWILQPCVHLLRFSAVSNLSHEHVLTQRNTSEGGSRTTWGVEQPLQMGRLVPPRLGIRIADAISDFSSFKFTHIFFCIKNKANKLFHKMFLIYLTHPTNFFEPSKYIYIKLDGLFYVTATRYLFC